MSQRLLKIILPQEAGNEALQMLGEREGISYWQEEAADGQAVISALTSSGQSEEIMDLFERRFSSIGEFRLILLPVQATIPRVTQLEQESKSRKIRPKGEEKSTRIRVSREELYAELSESAQLTPTYVAMVLLSTTIAAIGLLRSNGALIIGAMVLAPFLGPNVAAALSSTLADRALARRAFRTLMAGILLAAGLSVVFGALFKPDQGTPEIALRTGVGLFDITVALCSGCAGVLAFTTGAPTTLIGVMVAVALLPPLSTAGLLLGAGQHYDAVQALLLFLANLICINLAGVVTFLLQSIRPRTWWEAEKAKRATRIAILLWSMVLLLLVAVIIAADHGIAIVR